MISPETIAKIEELMREASVFEEDLDFGSIRCPKCDAELEFDMSSDDGEDK